MADTTADAKATVTKTTSDRQDPTPSGVVSVGTQPGGTTGKEQFSANELNAHPLLPTATDAQGIERVIGPAVDNWQASPIEASDEELAAAERRVALEEEAKKRRGAVFSGENGEPEKNDPAQGGSQL